MIEDHVLNSTKELSYFGKSFAEGDFDGDGTKELFVGAPGFSTNGLGQVGAIYLTSANKTDEFPSEPFMMGPAAYSKFGYAMVALDINRDGIDDLVVSAPAFGKGGATDIGDYYPKDYNGRLFVYLG